MALKMAIWGYLFGAWVYDLYGWKTAYERPPRALGQVDPLPEEGYPPHPSYLRDLEVSRTEKEHTAPGRLRAIERGTPRAQES